MIPRFPDLKPIQIRDREYLHEILWKYQPETSEMTFTHLFLWRSHYGLEWSMYENQLFLVCQGKTEGSYALQPIGPAPRYEAATVILDWLHNERKVPKPYIARADKNLASELTGHREFAINTMREHYDYVYRSSDLVQLAGNKYHAEQNQISNLMTPHKFTYEVMNDNHIRQCMELLERWCGIKHCAEDMNLTEEWESVGEALANHDELGISGGVAIVDGRLEAFIIGELLNSNTGVVHIEKTNPEIKGLHAATSQHFVKHNWINIPFINREPDLGIEGLRKAKLSYHPDHFVEKYKVVLNRI